MGYFSFVDEFRLRLWRPLPYLFDSGAHDLPEYLGIDLEGTNTTISCAVGAVGIFSPAEMTGPQGLRQQVVASAQVAHFGKHCGGETPGLFTFGVSRRLDDFGIG